MSFERVDGPTCWFDFDDERWTEDGGQIAGHTCLLPADHDGPHDPTSNDDIIITFPMEQR